VILSLHDQKHDSDLEPDKIPPVRGFIFFAIPIAAAFALLAITLFFINDDELHIPRGDLAIDAAGAKSLAEGDGFWTPWERGSLFRPPILAEQFGHPMDQHPPLWSIAGAALIAVFKLSPLAALEWASFICHLAIIVMLVMAARRLDLGKMAFLPGLVYALCGLGAAFSFNGSLYTAQGGLYLLAALVMGRRSLDLKQAFFLGLILGAACLLNYQAAFIVAAFVIVRFIFLGREFFQAPNIGTILLVLIVFTATVSPWLIRNYTVFNDPFYSVNANYALAKAGAPFFHQIQDNALIFTRAPVAASELGKGALRCIWQNIPFTFFLLLSLLPGSAAVIMLHPFTKNKRNHLFISLLVILVLHLGLCIAWPAVKLRYLAPAAPIILLLALHICTHNPIVNRKWLALVTVVAGLFCAAAWIKGSNHGSGLMTAYVVSFLPMAVLLFLNKKGSAHSLLRKALPLVLAALCLISLGTAPGQAYFNLYYHHDFVGQDKETIALEEGADLVKASRIIQDQGIQTLLGDLRLHSINPSLKIATLPQIVNGEDYFETLKSAANRLSIRYALLYKNLYKGNEALLLIKPEWTGDIWTLINLFPEK